MNRAFFRGLQALLLVLCLSGGWLAAQAGVARKGDDRHVDVTLSEGFETAAWSLDWTVVDADGSGDGWRRLGTEQYYTPHAGSWALGSRFRDDGLANDDWLISPALRPDSTRRFFKIWYRSQDAAHPESVEFLTLQGDRVLNAVELEARLGEFVLEERLEAPASWQEWSFEVPVGSTAVWHFAVRHVSRDRFVLLVDDASGFQLLPRARWALEDSYRRFDFGLVHADSVKVKPFRLWNLDADDSLRVDVLNRPLPPFVRSTARRAGAGNRSWDVGDSLYLWKADPDGLGSVDSLRIDFGVVSAYVDTTGGATDTLRYFGGFHDVLWLELRQQPDNESQFLEIPFTVTFWSPDSLARLDLLEDFEGGLPGWTRRVGAGATDTLSWELGDASSSTSFSVPLHGRFAFVNSDARGAYLADGQVRTQDAWLESPWRDVSHTRDGAEARGLLLSWDQVYLPGAGGRLDVLARDSADADWVRVGGPSGSPGWEDRSLDLSTWAGRDSLQLAFRYTGSWSYGVALDNVVLLAVADELPGEPAPPQPPVPTLDTVLLAPNPFNPVTVIHWRAAEAGRLDVQVFNLLGQRVLERGPWLLRPGANALPLDFGPLASGVYLVRMVHAGAQGEVSQHLRRVTFLK
jgi:hypothetical protein